MISALALTLIGCSSQSMQHSHWTYSAAVDEASPAAANLERKALFSAYRVLDLGKPGVPRLNAKQLAWLHRVMRTPYYARQLAKLWFGAQASVNHPLVVFLGPTSETEMTTELAQAGFSVIGDPCHDIYTAYDGEIPQTPGHDDPDCAAGRLPSISPA